MTWVWVGLAFVLGFAVTWYLAGRRQQRVVVPGAPAAHEDAASEDAASTGAASDGAEHPDDDEADASGFGGTPTPASESVGPAEAWRRDAEDEDALLGRDDDVAGVPPVAEATPNGDLAGVGEPEAVAAVEAESEADAPTPTDPEERRGPSGVSG